MFTKTSKEKNHSPEFNRISKIREETRSMNLQAAVTGFIFNQNSDQIIDLPKVKIIHNKNKLSKINQSIYRIGRRINSRFKNGVL